MTNKRRYTLLVFDWEGTLYDPYAHELSCLKLASSEQGFEIDQSTARNCLHLSMADLLNQLCPTLKESEQSQFLTKYKACKLSSPVDRQLLFEGSVDMLNDLHEQGYQLAIATGRGRTSLNNELKQLEIEHLFVTTVTADEAPSKPNPDMLIDIMDANNIAADNTLMIGDTDLDLNLASNAGTDCVLITQMGENSPKVISSNYITCLKSITELPSWLEKNALKP